MALYSIIKITGPGTGTLWEGYFRYFPFIVRCMTKQDHDMMIGRLSAKFLRYEIISEQQPKEEKIEVEENLEENVVNVSIHDSALPIQDSTSGKRRGRRRVEVTTPSNEIKMEEGSDKTLTQTENNSEYQDLVGPSTDIKTDTNA